MAWKYTKKSELINKELLLIIERQLKMMDILIFSALIGNTLDIYSLKEFHEPVLKDPVPRKMNQQS